jgi:hypothetical protein
VEEEHPQDKPIIEAARAIALHNFAAHLGEVSFETYPLLFLLIVSDELQEWSRPIPVSLKDSYFTTSFEKITFLDAISHNHSSEIWDIPYSNVDAKRIVRFDFKWLCNDKRMALDSLDCSEQYPESEIWLTNLYQTSIQPGEKFNIKIRTR